MKVKKTENLLYLLGPRDSGPTIIDLNKERPLYVGKRQLCTYDDEAHRVSLYKMAAAPAELSRAFGTTWFQTYPGSGYFVNPDEVDWERSHHSVSYLSPDQMNIWFRGQPDVCVDGLPMFRVFPGYEKYFPKTPTKGDFFLPGHVVTNEPITLGSIFDIYSQDYGRTVSVVRHEGNSDTRFVTLPSWEVRVSGELIAPFDELVAALETFSKKKLAIEHWTRGGIICHVRKGG